jgi:fumarylacetoacetase
MSQLNATHDPALRSWVEPANHPQADFPIQNLPFAVLRRSGTSEAWRCAVAIGDQALDLHAAYQQHLLSGLSSELGEAVASADLRALMARGHKACSALRAALSQALQAGRGNPDRTAGALIPLSGVEFALPARIGDYTDFYASIHHATAVGRLFRPDNPLLPNYKWLPVAYHGRASSVRVSGQEVCRPLGQIPGDSGPKLLPTRRLDYELELGVLIGCGNDLGEPVPLGEAEAHVFGLCLLNDWSARDIQAWEYQPLGPFLSKSFATTISPWVVTLEALAPYRLPWLRPADDPPPLPYLEGDAQRSEGAFDIHLEVLLETQDMRTRGLPPHRLSRSNFRHAYWTVAQMVAHHTINGCNLEPGDLLGTGTQSGPAPQEAGSLLELTAGGKQPLSLPSGEERTFLQDGDRVTLRAWCENSTSARIGFGAVSGTIVSSPPMPAAVEGALRA